MLLSNHLIQSTSNGSCSLVDLIFRKLHVHETNFIQYIKTLNWMKIQHVFDPQKKKNRTKWPSKSEKLLIWCSNYTIQLTIFGRCIFGVFIKNNMFLSLSTAIKCCSVFMTMTTNVEYVRARYGTYLPQFTVHNSFSSIILIYCVTACSY